MRELMHAAEVLPQLLVQASAQHHGGGETHTPNGLNVDLPLLHHMPCATGCTIRYAIFSRTSRLLMLSPLLSPDLLPLRLPRSDWD